MKIAPWNALANSRHLISLAADVSTQKKLLQKYGNCLGSWHCRKFDCLNMITGTLPKYSQPNSQWNCQTSQTFRSLRHCSCFWICFARNIPLLIWDKCFAVFESPFAWFCAIKLMMRILSLVSSIFLQWNFADRKVWTNMLTIFVSMRRVKPQN